MLEQRAINSKVKKSSIADLRTAFVDFRSLSIVQPGIVEHESNVLDELPRIFVQSCLQT